MVRATFWLRHSYTPLRSIKKQNCHRLHRQRNAVQPSPISDLHHRNLCRLRVLWYLCLGFFDWLIWWIELRVPRASWVSFSPLVYWTISLMDWFALGCYIGELLQVSPLTQSSWVWAPPLLIFFLFCKSGPSGLSSASSLFEYGLPVILISPSCYLASALNLC